MKVADYIVKHLLNLGIEDAFGVPGGVILELLYAMHREEGFTPHLAYHEQGAAFAASGYAQSSGKIGVAYCTRGPGVTNAVTAIADAFYEAIPVLLITAHSADANSSLKIAKEDQEIDTISLFRSISKYAETVEVQQEVKEKITEACKIALAGKKGPVLLDFSARLLSEEWEITSCDFGEDVPCYNNETEEVISTDIIEAINKASRPVFLIGEGVRETAQLLGEIADRINIPVLSSRAAQDIIPKSRQYFGYIGSHGKRFSNFILSKADLVVSLGNRMSFPVNSKSFRPIFENNKSIRVEIDERELTRKIPNCRDIMADANSVIRCISNNLQVQRIESEWMQTCEIIREELFDADISKVILELSTILRKLPDHCSIVSDVGNHEFWLSSAYLYAGVRNRLLYSKSFGTLGCGLPKAIGTSCATNKPVVCFVGDQGMQFNIQELQTIADLRAPIAIVLINNNSSGMIRSREINRPYFLHTTRESGYGMPNYELIARAYGIVYRRIEDLTCLEDFKDFKEPILVEWVIDEEIGLEPTLPKGNKIQMMEPLLREDLYKRINEM